MTTQILNKLNKKGFTMVELLVVVAIIMIMAAATLVILDPYNQFLKGNDVRRKADLSQIQKALEVYYQDHGRYPISTDLHKINSCDSDNVSNCAKVDWNTPWTPDYMNVLPADPSSPTKDYAYSSTGQSYYLYASLDRGNDPQVCQSLKHGECTNVPFPGMCGTNAKCNYGVTSPDLSP